jgi:hypothetical protein
MNEELKNQLSQFLAKALDVAEKGIDTAGEQIPALLQEIVQWQLFSAIGFVALFTTISILGFAFSYYLYRDYKQTNYDDNLYISIISAVVVLFIFFASLICNLPIIIKVLTAPRLVILEYLKGLL